MIASSAPSHYMQSPLQISVGAIQMLVIVQGVNVAPGAQVLTSRAGRYLPSTHHLGDNLPTCGRR